MLKDFISGFTSYVKAVEHVSRFRMWGYVLLPGFISILIGIAIFATAYGLSDDIGQIIIGFWKRDFAKGIVSSIANIFGGLLLAALGLLVFKQLVMVVTAPFLSILSEKVERQLTGYEDTVGWSLPKILKDISRGLAIAVRNLIRELTLTILLLIIGLIPVFTPFTSALIFILQSFYAGFGNLDFALERHFGYRDSIRFVKAHKGLAIGNGMVFLLLLFTFVGFLVAMPLGTVAATIETVKRLDEIEK
ncbi:MAG: coproporphyrinogen III oxidase [Saprospirales bacterium]|nr:coproporphyrinogen III oxidase [Saprospirales bacterium]